MKWKTVVMEHDSASTELMTYFRELWGTELHTVSTKGESQPFPPTEHYDVDIKLLMEQMGLPAIDGNVLVMYGDGGFHHYTYGLCHAASMRKNNDGFLYIQIDHHTDAGNTHRGNRRGGGKEMYLSCGSFVRELRWAGAKNFMYVATESQCGDDVKYIKEADILAGDIPKLIRKELWRKNPNVYISVDLDVMDVPEVATGFARGKLKLHHMLEIIDVIQNSKNIIGADILGYCGAGAYYYDKGRKEDAKEQYNLISYLTYAALASKIIGKDYSDVVKQREELMERG